MDYMGIIKESIKLEINGKKFFEYAVEATSNELGKKMFKKLATDEIRHLEAFGGIYAELISTDEWQSYVKAELNSKSQILEKFMQRVASEKKEKAGDTEAIRIGMELERSAIDFFSTAAKQACGTKYEAVFHRICDEEKTHLDLLQAQLDTVTNTGNWFDVSEFKMDGQY